MTGHLPYTEDPELGELVRSALPIDPADGTIVVGYDNEGLPKWGDPKTVIAAVLAALSDRLVPPGSETEWARRTPSGLMWRAESREEAVEDLKRNEVGELLSRIVTPWSPSVPDTEEGS